MNTPEEDAVDFVYDVLNAHMGVGGALRALGVKALVKDEPGSPHENYVAVLFGGVEELDSSGLARVNVLVDIWSQELMMGVTTNKLARFTKRIQLCRQLIRSYAAAQRDVEVGPMVCPVEPTEPDANKHYFFNATITVPVIVGGGI